ncbi:MAG: hypothetical protein HY040_08290 [Planctomycetes bacterium]|nr:hypothetical protein [Planctomycetota bacterium]
MTRMSKEFSLVLLGAGILTAGSFFMPEENLDARADQAAAQQVGAHHAGTGHTRSHGLLFIHTGRWAGGASASPARAGISRSGFGSIGRSVSVSS